METTLPDMDQDLWLRLGLALTAVGVALHVLYFRRHEHHMHGVRYFQVTLLAFGLISAYLLRVLQLPLQQTLVVAGSLLTCLFSGVYASLLSYRLLFHPLRKFPGPVAFRLTGLCYTYMVRTGDAHHKLLALHRKHGPIVRVGPCDLSIANGDAVQTIYGVGSNCRKGPWYDTDAPRISMHSTRDHSFHSQRRRVWSPAFSEKSLRGFESRVEKHNDLLASQLEKAGGKPINASKWLMWWAFDVMGDVAFSRDFGMLAKGEEHWAIHLLHLSFEMHNLKLPVWAMRVLLAVPGLTKDYFKFIDFCDQQLSDRIANEPKTPDVMSTLLPTVNPKSMDDSFSLKADARVLIVAGSDTTASTLISATYWLAKHPELQKNIRDELDELLGVEGKVDHQKIQKADHLNGLINETLRLNPAVPTMMQRVTPREGIKVVDTFIPGGMNVFCAPYVTAREESSFEKATEFVPERWHAKEEMVKDPNAYAPFSIGPYGCIGKQLALMELRTNIASLIRKFDIKFAPGGSEEKYFDDTKDQFILWPAELNVCFVPRAK